MKYLLIIYEDIHPNPPPPPPPYVQLPKLLHTPQNQYFIKGTTNLKNKFTHLTELFQTYTNPSPHQPMHLDLRGHCQAPQNYPTPHLIFCFITTLSQTPNTCNEHLITQTNPHYATILQQLVQQPLPHCPTHSCIAKDMHTLSLHMNTFNPYTKSTSSSRTKSHSPSPQLSHPSPHSSHIRGGIFV